MSESGIKITGLPGGIFRLHWLPPLATVLMLHRCYIPGGSAWNLLGLFMWFCIGASGLVRLLISLKKSSPRVKKPILPTLILLGISLLTLTHIPIRLGLWACLPAFEAFAREVKEKKLTYKRNFLDRSTHVRKQLGFYPIYDYALEDDGGVYLLTYVGGFINTDLIGFAYKPHPNRPYAQGTSHRSELLWGDWYMYEEMEKF